MYQSTFVEGRLDGIKEGMKEGEKAEKIRTAKALKANHLAPEMIIKITGLSAEELENL